MRRHAESSVRPADQLHRRRVGDQVGQLASRLVEQPGIEELLPVLGVEHLLHRRPEPLLPLEDRLLGHHVRRDVLLEAPAEEEVGQIPDVVVRVVVNDADVVVVRQISLVDDERGVAVLGQVRREERPCDVRM